MPRGFSETEMSRIRESVLREGENLFAQFGIAKTTVEDVCKRVSISKGTFYKLFESKDTLLFEIIGVLNEEFQKRVAGDILSQELPPRERFKRLLHIQVEAYKDHPILMELLKPETFAPGVLKLSEEQRALLNAQSLERRKRIFTDILNMDTLSLKEPEQIASLFRSLFFLYQKKEELPVTDIDPVMHFLIEAMANQLIED